MMHPLFAGFDERHDLREIAQALGFDWHEVDESGIEEALLEHYERAPGDALASWEPAAPEGFFLIDKVDHEDGPLAMFVKPLTPLAWALWMVATGQKAQAEPPASFFSHDAVDRGHFVGQYPSHAAAAEAGRRIHGVGRVETCEFHPVLASDLVAADDLIDAANERADDHSAYGDELPSIDPTEQDEATLNDALGLLFGGWVATVGAAGADWPAAPGETITHDEAPGND